MKYIFKGVSHYIKTSFRRCTVEDFKSRNMAHLSEKELSVYTKRFCPATEILGDNYFIKNGYTNSTERVSFSVEVVRCNPDVE